MRNCQLDVLFFRTRSTSSSFGPGRECRKRSLRGPFASIRERYRNGSKDGETPTQPPAHTSRSSRRAVRLCWTRWRRERREPACCGTSRWQDRSVTGMATNQPGGPLQFPVTPLAEYMRSLWCAKHRLIARGPLHVVDDEIFADSLGRRELQPEPR